MSLHATVTDLQTGELLQRLGPFESASAARTACAEAAGEVLLWERAGQTWEAQTLTEVYQVPRTVTIEAE